MPLLRHFLVLFTKGDAPHQAGTLAHEEYVDVELHVRIALVTSWGRRGGPFRSRCLAQDLRTPVAGVDAHVFTIIVRVSTNLRIGRILVRGQRLLFALLMLA